MHFLKKRKSCGHAKSELLGRFEEGGETGGDGGPGKMLAVDMVVAADKAGAKLWRLPHARGDGPFVYEEKGKVFLSSWCPAPDRASPVTGLIHTSSLSLAIDRSRIHRRWHWLVQIIYALQACSFTNAFEICPPPKHIVTGPQQALASVYP